MNSADLIGRTISRYTILEKIGEGGMGVVYRAHDTRLDRMAAFKVLPPEAVHDSERRRRFIQEARTASALNHPCIVTIYDIDAVDGLHYIAMEHVAGTTLDKLIRQGLRLTDLLKYAAQIADALATAHAAGIVHRDLKPSNVIVTDRGSVKLLDFGLAKLVDPVRVSDDATRTIPVAPKTVEGTIVGTVAYMSPEQAEGLEVDHRSDIFSFGTMLYEMAAGRRPFRGETPMSTLSAILSREPAPMNDVRNEVPHDLERIIHRCLRKEREKRIQHMDDVKLALEELGDDLKSAGSVAELDRARREISHVSDVRSVALDDEPSATRRRVVRRLAAAGLGVLLFAAAAAWTGWLLTRGAPPPLEPPVLSRLTSDAGISAFPALSADGKLLAFASDRSGDGNLDIWVQQTLGGNPIRLTTDPTDEYEATFSPDGTRIAFRSDREGGGVYVISTLGGDSRLIAKAGRRPRFSPDGQWVAYWAGAMGATLVPGSTGVYVVSANGGEPRRVRQEFAASRHPLWMPDGRLLFVGRRDANGELAETVDWWIAPVEGGAVLKTGALDVARKRGLRPPAGDYTINPTEMAPGGTVVLFSASVGDSTNVWQMPLSSSTGRVSGDVRQVTYGAGMEVQPVAARDRSGVAFSSLALNVDLWRAPLDAKRGTITGAPERLTQDLSFEAYPALSGDGSRLVFVASRSNGWEVRLRDLTAGKETVLASAPSQLAHTRISADGRRVVYWERGQTNQAAYLVEAAGGVAEKLCDDCGPPTDISPDGTWVLLDRAGAPERGIMLVNARSRQLIPLIRWRSHPDASLYSARFAPDSRWIAFHATMASTARRVFVVPFRVDHDAAAPRPIEEADWIAVTDGSAWEWEASWSPDGSILSFLSERDGFRCLWARRLAPETKQPLGTPFAVQHFHNARLSLAGAGVRSAAPGLAQAPGIIVFALGELTGNIWLASERAHSIRE